MYLNPKSGENTSSATSKARWCIKISSTHLVGTHGPCVRVP